MSTERLTPRDGQRCARQTSLFVIDDEPGFCQSLKVLAECRGMECLVFDSARAFLEFTQACDTRLRAAWQPACGELAGCLVTDLHMPEMSGAQLIREMYQRRLRMPVIVVSGDCRASQAVHCMRMGAAGYYEKPFDPNTLLDHAMEVAHWPVEHLRNPDASREKLRSLTPREREIMVHVCDGKLNKTIADLLGISVKTVELHRARLCNKLGVRSIPELVRLNLGY